MAALARRGEEDAGRGAHVVRRRVQAQERADAAQRRRAVGDQVLVADVQDGPEWRRALGGEPEMSTDESPAAADRVLTPAYRRHIFATFAATLAFAAFYFYFAPRTGVSWSQRMRQRRATVGFTNQVTLNELRDTIQTNELVMRVEIDYKYPLRSGDRFWVGLNMVKESRLRYVFLQDIFLCSDNIQVLKAKITGTSLNPEGRPAVSAELEEAFANIVL